MLAGPNLARDAGASTANAEACACGAPRASSALLRQVRPQVTIRRCLSCGLAFTHPVPYAESLDCHDYSEEDTSHDDPSRREEFAGYARELLARATGTKSLLGTSLLDVGCGGGELLEVARELGAGIAGIEINPHHRSRLAARGIPTVTSLAEIAAHRFDWIVLSHVLEHVPGPVTFLSDLRALLDAGGCLVISLPNLDSFLARRLGRFWVGLRVEQHLWHFTPRSLESLLHRGGFRVTNGGAYALGRGRGPNGEALYSGATFLLDSQGLLVPRLVQGVLLAADRLLRGTPGRAIRRFAERRGADNLWAVASPIAS